MQIFELQDTDKAAWDEFVLNLDQATIFHLSGWEGVMTDTFGLKPRFLIAKENGQICGGLPLIHIKSTLSGHYFTSMPGGLCTQDEQAARVLVDHAKELVRDAGAKYLILRDSHHKWDLPELVTNEDHCTFIVQLCGNTEKMWKTIDRRVRQHIQKAIKEDLTVTIGPEYLEDFYDSYSKVMREMGTPTFGLKFFQNVFNQFPENFTTIMVHNHETSYGGIVAACFKNTIYTVWWGMLREYYQNRSCHILNWETFKYGCRNEFCQVDLGRSRWNSGTFTFKERWPAEPKPLYQQFFLNGISEPPGVGSDMDEDPKYRFFVRLWKYLPLKLTDTIGPQLRKRMPFG
jgi:FemAB-related protein (PEP-CTERM system-associated)